MSENRNPDAAEVAAIAELLRMPADQQQDRAAMLDQLAEILQLPETAPAPTLPPLLTTGQRQGDVFVQPDPFTVTWRHARRATWLADGQDVVIVPDGNGHLLRVVLGDGGRVRAWRHRPTGNAVLSVEILAPAYCLLVQPTGPNPHPPVGIAAGQYLLCRQTEPQVLAPVQPTPRQAWRDRVSDTYVID